MELSSIRGHSRTKDGSRLVEREAPHPNHEARLDDMSLDHDQTRLGDGESEFRSYKIRWFGLFQLVLLNIIVSWDVSVPTPRRKA